MFLTPVGNRIQLLLLKVFKHECSLSNCTNDYQFLIQLYWLSERLSFDKALPALSSDFLEEYEKIGSVCPS